MAESVDGEIWREVASDYGDEDIIRITPKQKRKGKSDFIKVVQTILTGLIAYLLVYLIISYSQSAGDTTQYLSKGLNSLISDSSIQNLTKLIDNHIGPVVNNTKSLFKKMKNIRNRNTTQLLAMNTSRVIEKELNNTIKEVTKQVFDVFTMTESHPPIVGKPNLIVNLSKLHPPTSKTTGNNNEFYQTLYGKFSTTLLALFLGLCLVLLTPSIMSFLFPVPRDETEFEPPVQPTSSESFTTTDNSHDEINNDQKEFPRLTKEAVEAAALNYSGLKPTEEEKEEVMSHRSLISIHSRKSVKSVVSAISVRSTRSRASISNTINNINGVTPGRVSKRLNPPSATHLTVSRVEEKLDEDKEEDNNEDKMSVAGSVVSMGSRTRAKGVREEKRESESVMEVDSEIKPSKVKRRSK